MQTTVTRTIAAPAERVFDTVAHIDNFRHVVPDIVDVQMLSETTSGVGTRFRETRQMHGRQVSTELEVTEYVPNERVRLVSEVNGTVWDTVFQLREQAGGTELRMVMDARARKLLPRLINPLIKGMITKAIAKDMDALKAHCEGAAHGVAGGAAGGQS